MLQLYLIRHAQSENNALYARSNSFEGRQPDPGLTEMGERQADILASFLARHNPDVQVNGPDVANRWGFGLTHLYTSLFQRAIQTALPVARATGLPLEAWPDVHEWWGVYRYIEETDERIGLPGPDRHFFQANYPELILPDGLDEGGWWDRPAENFEQVHKRALRVVKTLLARHGGGGDRVALITHGGFSHSLLQVLLKVKTPNERLDGEPAIWFRANNTAITRIDLQPSTVVLAYANRLDHLPPELIT